MKKNSSASAAVRGGPHQDHVSGANVAPDKELLSLLSGVLDHTHVMAAYLDPAFNFLWVNRAYAASMAEPPAFFIGKNHFELLPDEENRAVFRRVVETGEPFFDFGKPFVYPDHERGHVTYWDWSLMPIKDEAGKVQGLVLTLLEVTERIHAEMRLRQNEEKYRLIAQNAMDVIWTMGLDLKFTYFSPSIRYLTGFTTEEAERFTLPELLTPESLVKASRWLAEEIARDQDPGVAPDRSRMLEIDHWRKDGSTVWVEVTVSFLRDETGSPCGVIGISRDISARREAEAALKKSEKKYRSLVEQSLQGLVIVQRDPLRLSFVSGPVQAIFGYTPEEMMAFSPDQITALIHPDFREPLFRNVRIRFTTPTNPVKNEYQIVHRDGRNKWVETFSALIEFEGSPAVQTVMVDITKRRNAFEELKRSEARNEAMLATIPDLLFVFDDQFRMVDYKSGDKRSLLMPPEKFLGKAIRETLPSHLWDLTEEKIRATLAANRIQTYEYQLPLPDRTHFFEARMTICGKGQVLAIVRDITARKEAEAMKDKLEEQLRQAMKMESIGRLAGGVAHDFNNLLTGIIGYAEMIRAGLDSQDPLFRDMEEILGASRRAAGLTAQLLAFSRKQLISPRVVQPNDVLADSQNMLRRIIGEDVRLEFVPASDLGTVKIDPTQLDQVLINLAVNARDAMPGGGRLIIATHNVHIDDSFCFSHIDAEPGEYVRLTVSDTGCGMDAETQARIFEPFFSTKDKERGTGLGLATVYGIVRQNNGFITVESAPGAGTTFQVHFPLIREKAAERVHLPAVTLPIGHETVLLVEDEEMVRNMARKILERHGYQVLVARDGEDAERQCREFQGEIHLLLTDVIMPELDGRQLYLRLAETRAGLKALFMSGYTDDIIAKRGVLEEGIDFLQKPFTMEELTRRVRNALDRGEEG